MAEEKQATELEALSADYEFNSAVTGDRDRFTYDPKRYDYPDNHKADGKGYSFTHHSVLKDTNDEAFANHTFVGLNAHADMGDVAVNEDVDVADLVLFTSLKAPNGNYVKNVNGNLFAITSPEEVLTDKNMFKIYRSRYSGRGFDIDGKGSGGPKSYVISQGSKYATVKMFMNRFNVEMKELIKDDPLGIQHYRIFQIPGTNRISIYSMMEAPWEAEVGKYTGGNAGKPTEMVDPVTDQSTGNDKYIYDTITDVHRFWSLYDGLSSDRSPFRRERYPKHTYESNAPWPNMVKINGNIFNSKYTKESQTGLGVDGIDTLSRVGNNYLFEAGYLADGYDRYIMIGYDGKIRWVKYFNEFYDKFFNSNVTPDKIIEDVKPSIVYECPYKTVMDKDGFKLNFVELKNVMTPGYSYSAFEKDTLDNGQEVALDASGNVHTDEDWQNIND